MTVVPDHATLCGCRSPISTWGKAKRPEAIKRDCPKCHGVGWYTDEGPGHPPTAYFPPGVEMKP